jgi:DNA-binding NarL/FixJ family response regulator
MEKIRLIITEDEPLFRELLLRTLSTEPRLEVVGTAEDAETAIRLSRKVKPDVAIMDIELPGEMDGIEAALIIKRERPKTGIVILSVHSDHRYVSSLPLGDLGGWAYLLKQSVPDLSTLVRAIHGSKEGMMVLDPAVMAKLRPRQDSPVASLTPRLQEVLRLIAQGYNNAAIAERLVLSERSVEGYVKSIYQELYLSGEPEIHARVKAALTYLESARKINF